MKYQIDEEKSRYLLLSESDELLSSLDYSINQNAIAFTRTFTPPNQRGKGYAADIVKYAVEKVAEGRDSYIVPTCWYVAQWFERNPDYAHLLEPQS